MMVTIPEVAVKTLLAKLEELEARNNKLEAEVVRLNNRVEREVNNTEMAVMAAEARTAREMRNIANENISLIREKAEYLSSNEFSVINRILNSFESAIRSYEIHKFCEHGKITRMDAVSGITHIDFEDEEN